MPRGGARSRSGPPADPDSGRSDRRGFSLQSLPNEGYKGRVPAFPLPDHKVYVVDAEGNEKLDKVATAAFRRREREVWAELWRTPQAAAWIRPENKWRWRIVALYTRHTVRCESADVPASLLAQIHRFGDQIGMTDAGLTQMGWRIAASYVVEPETKPTKTTPPRMNSTSGSSARDRLKVVNGGA